MMETAAPEVSGKEAGPWLLVWRGINLLMAIFFLLATLANVRPY